MKSLKSLLFAGIATLALTLACSANTASYTACAAPLTTEEMKEIRGEGQITVHGTVYQWTSTATFYLIVQTPYGAQQVPCSIAVNAYYLASTFTSSTTIPDPTWQTYYAHIYRGGSLNGRQFGSRQTNVPYYHVVNGWPVGGL
jgi:hypothetical protein